MEPREAEALVKQVFDFNKRGTNSVLIRELPSGITPELAQEAYSILMADGGLWDDGREMLTYWILTPSQIPCVLPDPEEIDVMEDSSAMLMLLGLDWCYTHRCLVIPNDVFADLAVQAKTRWQRQQETRETLPQALFGHSVGCTGAMVLIVKFLLAAGYNSRRTCDRFLRLSEVHPWLVANLLNSFITNLAMFAGEITSGRMSISSITFGIDRGSSDRLGWLSTAIEEAFDRGDPVECLRSQSRHLDDLRRMLIDRNLEDAIARDRRTLKRAMETEDT